MEFNLTFVMSSVRLTGGFRQIHYSIEAKMSVPLLFMRTSSHWWSADPKNRLMRLVKLHLDTQKVENQDLSRASSDVQRGNLSENIYNMVSRLSSSAKSTL